MAITTADDYQAFTGSTVADVVVTSAIGIAQAQLERWAGRAAGGFETGAKTEYYDGTDAETLQLKCWPATAITSVSYRTDKTTWVALTSTDYDVEIPTGILYLLNLSSVWPGDGRVEFWGGRQNWKVVYTGGFTTLPADLIGLVWDMVTAILSARDQDMNLQSESVGDYSYTLAPFEDRFKTWAKSAGGFLTGGL